MDELLIYLLLLLAVAAGWVLGRVTFRDRAAGLVSTQAIFQDYFVGLNYLLNDEPDEAIDTFIKALEINSETVETHLALGALLRRRGRVDKAIKVHQALLGRQGLDASFFDPTRLQLAMDYITAGLLDRAESLLKEIHQEGSEARWQALEQLATVYQTEKEWEQALGCVQALLQTPVYRQDAVWCSIAAHYCCELAESAIRNKQLDQAGKEIQRAFRFDASHVRASLLQARLERCLGNTPAAIEILLRVRTDNLDFSAWVLELLREWHPGSHQQRELEVLLNGQLTVSPDAILLRHLACTIQQGRGNGAAVAFLQSHYDRYPSLEGMLTLLRLHLADADSQGPVRQDLARIEQHLRAILDKQHSYQCSHCGYESRNLYWLCPSCQRWDKTRPISRDLVQAGN